MTTWAAGSSNFELGKFS